MSSQTSKLALQSIDKAEVVVASTRTQGPLVSAELMRVFGGVVPGGEGESPPLPDWKELQDLHAALLESAAGEVRQADHEHRLLLVRAAQLRRERSALIEGLHSRYRDLRRSFAGVYGEESLALVGLDAPPMRSNLVAIREQTLEVLERLRDPALVAALPPPRADQAPINLKSLADAMEGEVRALEVTMDELRRLRKQLDESLVGKHSVIKGHRRILVNVARIQEGYYRLAGLDELADRIRAVEPQRPSEPEGEEGGGDDGEPDSGTPTGGTSTGGASAGGLPSGGTAGAPVGLLQR